jgi:hypothetical protein
MTGELDEEWPAMDDTADDDSINKQQSRELKSSLPGEEAGDNVAGEQQQRQRGSINTISSSGSMLHRVASSVVTRDYQPRVPSSLGRYSTTTAASDHDAQRDIQHATQTDTLSSSTTSNSAGTFVVRSNPSTSGNHTVEQLQAAVKALQGPTESAGLLGAVLQETASADRGLTKEQAPANDKLGGLLSLFEPPSPPTNPSQRELTDQRGGPSALVALLHCCTG